MRRGASEVAVLNYPPGQLGANRSLIWIPKTNSRPSKEVRLSASACWLSNIFSEHGLVLHETGPDEFGRRRRSCFWAITVLIMISRPGS